MTERRLQWMVAKCRQKSCGCEYGCKVDEEIAQRMIEQKQKLRRTEQHMRELEQMQKTIREPMPTLNQEVLKQCPEGCEPVVVFDGEEAYCEWLDKDNYPQGDAPWFFNETDTWLDGCVCELLGIRWESV